MSDINGSYILNEESIDKVSVLVYKYLKEKDYPKEALLSCRLSLESILLQWLERGGAGKNFTVEAKKTFGRLHILLKLEGERINCGNQAQEIDYFNTIQNNLGSFFSLKYLDNTNIADIKLPRVHISSMGQVGIAIALAGLLGTILPMLLSEATLKTINKIYITPAFTTIIGILGGFASFQILFSILDTIIHMGNIAVLKSIGVKYFKICFSSILATTCISAAALTAVFPLVNLDGSDGGDTLSMIYKLLIDIVPTNVVVPFTQGNLLQIVFLAVFLGIILLILGDEVAGINRDTHEINKVFSCAVACISKLMPLFIFLSFLSLFLEGHVKQILGFWQLLVTILGTQAITVVIMLVLACFFAKLSPMKFIQLSTPASLLGFSTASTLAASPLIIKALESQGVEESNYNFSVNFGLIFCKHSDSIMLFAIVYYCQLALGRTFGLGDYIMLIFTCFILAVALPSIPGGDIAVITNLMLQYSIPLELIGAVLTIDFIIDMLTTGVKCSCMVSEGLIFDKFVSKANN